ncbi:MAG: hypothetical protein QM523_05990 [Candidatus Pacebacteria bacterium]|nr:hypothetical protein [Candidatus Paceibacterota bacterium]
MRNFQKLLCLAGLWFCGLGFNPLLASGGDYGYVPDITEVQDHVYSLNQVGIIGQGDSHHFDKLFISYRILIGKPLTDSDLDHFSNKEPASAPNPWMELRRTASNRPFPIQQVTPNSPTDPSELKEIWYAYCTPPGLVSDDAYAQAAATLKDRQAKYDAKWIEIWIEGQDAVFGNCPGLNQTSPSPLPSDAPEWLVLDRQYQMAAFYLYQKRFYEAKAAFTAIANNSRSPWQGLAKYLVIRTAYHQIYADSRQYYSDETDMSPRIIEQLKQVQADFRRLQKEFPQKISLMTRLDYLLAPEQRLAKLEKQLTQITRFTADDWHDYDDLKYISTHEFVTDSYDLKFNSFVTWQTAIRYPGLRQQTVAVWQTSKNPIWLVPIVINSYRLSDLSPEMVKAILAAPKTSPLWHSLNWYYARLLIKDGKLAEADRLVQIGLELTPLNQTQLRAVRNYWLQFKALTTASPDEFWQSLLRYNPYSQREFDKWSTELDDKNRPRNLDWLKNPETQNDLNDRLYIHLPLADLIAAIKERGASFPDRILAEMTQTAMTRAFLLDDWDAAKGLVDGYLEVQERILKADNYDFVEDWKEFNLLKQRLVAFKLAKSPEETRLAAAIAVLTGNLEPLLYVKYSYNYMSCESYRQSIAILQLDFDCSIFHPYITMSDFKEVVPRAFTPTQFAQSEAEAKTMIRDGSLRRSVWLANILIPAAKSNPQEPRLPEAFYRMINSTNPHWHFLPRNYKGNSEDKKRYAHLKEAFALAHRLWPKDPWVIKTKYWYENEY